MKFSKIKFIESAHSLSQLPEGDRPEIAFAGRSNVGKSSLMNKLFKRKGLVKVSGRPGKTQGLNYFAIEDIYFVDLPGYGFAKVSKSMQDAWQKLITQYLSSRENLQCVVVIIDIRHPPKAQDAQLIEWLKIHKIPYLPIYTKADKLTANKKMQHAKALDAGHNIRKDERVLFSSKSGEGRDELIEMLKRFVADEK